MKILGYIDDFVSWQTSIGLWNWIVIPIELIIILEIYLKLVPRCRYP